MENDKNINQMDLHEIINFGRWEILRVVDGWIYTRKDEHAGSSNTSTFVPDVS